MQEQKCQGYQCGQLWNCRSTCHELGADGRTQKKKARQVEIQRDILNVQGGLQSRRTNVPDSFNSLVSLVSQMGDNVRQFEYIIA